MHPFIPFVFLVLFVTTYGQESKANCDNYESGTTGNDQTCWYCDAEEWNEGQCYNCDVLWELDCDTCSCVVSPGGWVVSVVVWAMIYLCCGICVYSYRKGHCCGNGLQGGRASIQAKNGPYRKLPDPRTQFVKCKFCGWLEKPGTIRCSKCNTSISSMSNIASSAAITIKTTGTGLVANDESVSENSLPSSSNPTDFIKCLSCNRYQFAKSDGKCFYCQALLPESKKRQVMQDEKQEEGVDIGAGMGSNNDQEKKCANCNEFVPNSFKFCNHCGSKLEVEDERQCVSCGGSFDKKCKFCPHCGSKAD